MCLYDYWSLQSYLGVFNSQKIVPCGTKKWNNWYLIAVSSHYTENTNMIWKPVESLINNWLCKKYLSSYLQIRFKKGSREVTKILSRDQNKNNKKGLEMTKYWLISCRSVMCIIRKDILCKDKVIQWKIIWIQASYVKYQKVEKDWYLPLWPKMRWNDQWGTKNEQTDIKSCPNLSIFMVNFITILLLLIYLGLPAYVTKILSRDESTT